MADSASGSDPEIGGIALDRRSLIASAGAAAAAMGFGTGSFAQADARAAGGGKAQSVRVTRGTNLAFTVSPDGKHIAFDLYGMLWLVDAGGGEARALTDELADVAQPDWSPDGRWIAFQSYRSGNYQIWRMAPDGTGLAQLTDGPFDAREPRWSPDGRSIVFVSDRAERYGVHVLDIASGAVRAITKGTAEESEPAWSPDGTTILYIADHQKLMSLPLAGGEPTILAQVPRIDDWFTPSALYGPAWTRDGKPLHFEVRDGTVKLKQGDKVLCQDPALAPLRCASLPGGSLVVALDGELRVLANGDSKPVPFIAEVSVARPEYRRMQRDFTGTQPKPVVGIASPRLSPDGQSIAFVALNDVYVVKVGGQARAVVNDASFKSHPAWSPDGRTIAYSSDRGGKLDIWLHDLAAGRERKLTQAAGPAFSPVWSQDGREIAFLDHAGAVHVVDVATGAIKLAYDRLVSPGRPSFSPDGKRIALAAFKPYSKRFREGLNEVLVIDRATGKGTYAPIAPHRSIATRGDDGPIWSPDGSHIAYIYASTLWILPVDAEGKSRGTARQLSREASDAPSWSGDSKTLLYLSNGKLRLVGRDGGKRRTVPLRLKWASAIPQGRTLIRAGRLWDGETSDYREHVDILVEGNKIASVGSAQGAPPTSPDIRFVDASRNSVIPGLIDMHTHRYWAHYTPGRLQGPLWLSMGITATRSPGCPAYQMVADREAIESGKRLGARHFATGEAFDGSRIFYEFMRPVTEPGQLALEVSRAVALDYDLIKTYVRLPHHQQAQVIEIAHRQGLPVASHYHWPSLHYGADAMEHLGATTRVGYSRTTQIFGGEQEDVTALFAAARADRTPTFFASSMLLLDDDSSFLEDPRIRAFFSPWDYDALVHRIEQLSKWDRQGWLRLLEQQVGQVKAVMERGWHVVSGTDAPGDFPGISLHLNLRAMTRFGISARDALLTATRHAGDALGGQVGAIVPGRLADLAIVDGDPLKDVADAAKVKAAVLNGVAHDVDTLLSTFGSPKALAHREREHREAPGNDPQYWWHSAAFVEAYHQPCCIGHAKGSA